MLDEASFDRLTAGAMVLGSDESGTVILRLVDGSRLELRPTGTLLRCVRLFRRFRTDACSELIAAYRIPGFDALHFRANGPPAHLPDFSGPHVFI